MPIDKGNEIERIKEVESINLAREEIRDEVIETKKAVEKARLKKRLRKTTNC